MEQFVGYTNQSILYSSTGMISGSVTGSGNVPDWHLVLYYWLIPNRNANQHIGIVVLVRSICVYCTKGLDCGSNGRIILGGGEEALVFCTGLLGCTAYGGVVPSAV